MVDALNHRRYLIGERRTPNAKRRAQNAERRAQNVKRRTSSAKRRAQSAERQAQSAKRQASSAKRRERQAHATISAHREVGAHFWRREAGWRKIDTHRSDEEIKPEHDNEDDDQHRRGNLEGWVDRAGAAPDRREGCAYAGCYSRFEVAEKDLLFARQRCVLTGKRAMDEAQDGVDEANEQGSSAADHRRSARHERQETRPGSSLDMRCYH